jgi:hypothetical protein
MPRECLGKYVMSLLKALSLFDHRQFARDRIRPLQILSPPFLANKSTRGSLPTAFAM